MRGWALTALLVAAALPWLSVQSRILACFNSLYPIGVRLMENTAIPDQVLDLFLRPAMRAGFWALTSEMEDVFAAQLDSQAAYVEKLTSSPIALFAGEANEQHYEVETQFFDIALGARKKYSAGLWPAGASVADAGGAELEQAEERMLDLYVQRADLRDGQTILDLGCGWGSVSLYLAERFPRARIIGVSNSRTQKAYILQKAQARGLKNVEVRTMNVAGEGFPSFLRDMAAQVDRIMSIEMFEHMKNYQALLRILGGGLKSGGKLFVHIFCHKYLAYDFEEDDLNAWMTKHFFKGGTMPSQFLLHRFQDDLTLRRQWNVDGRNYTLTLEGWLQRMDAKKEQLLSVFGAKQDAHAAALQVRRWRIFMIACAEFFGFRGGSEFFVTHLLFEKR